MSDLASVPYTAFTDTAEARAQAEASVDGAALGGVLQAVSRLGRRPQACHTATQALEPASAVASERVSGHLREFYDQLTPHRQEPVALAFEARLREILPTVSGSPHP